MIYVSTACFKYKNIENLFKNLKKNNIDNIELSYLNYENNLKKKLIKEKNFNFSIHNYFPPQKKPFVFNLASQNNKINEKSLKMAFNNISLSHKINSSVYSFHSGYLFDPFFYELGKKINNQNIYNKDDSIKIFIKNVKILSKIANKYNVKIMIENNVINKLNLKTFNQNPLLMCDIKETKRIFKLLPRNISLLVDVAHLKVSSETLKFDRSKYLHSLKEIIGGYHLSDNNGKLDTNKPFNRRSWFWNLINKNLKYYSIEVYNEPIIKIKDQIKIANEKINS